MSTEWHRACCLPLLCQPETENRWLIKMGANYRSVHKAAAQSVIRMGLLSS